MKSRCLVWENTIILKAPDREAAYEKALSIGREDAYAYENSDGEQVCWVFEGLLSLLPIYDELEDGAEIFWVEHKNRTVGKIHSWLKRKEALETFDDTPEIGSC